MPLDAKAAFSERLKLALRRSPKPVDSPTALSLQFNLRHPNDPITPQAAQKWLTGKAKPTSDKIETLAAWLDVSAHWLQYGTPEGEQRQARSEQVATPAAPTPEQQAFLANYQRLTPVQQRLVGELVQELLLDRDVWPSKTG